MRIIPLLTRGNLGSIITLAKLRRMKNVDIISVIVSPDAPGGLKKNMKYLKKMGLGTTISFFWQYLFTQAFLIYFKKTFKHLSRDLDVYETDNVNAPETIKYLQSKRPDYLLSSFFNQILKTESLSTAEVNPLNIHPANINEYRGAMNYFWVIHNNEKLSSATLHIMDEGIDTGKILHIKDFEILEKDTQFSVHAKSAWAGIHALQRMSMGQLNAFSLDKNQKAGEYYSIPSSSDFKFHRRKRPLFKISQIFEVIKKL